MEIPQIPSTPPRKGHPTCPDAPKKKARPESARKTTKAPENAADKNGTPPKEGSDPLLTTPLWSTRAAYYVSPERPKTHTVTTYEPTPDGGLATVSVTTFEIKH